MTTQQTQIYNRICNEVLAMKLSTRAENIKINELLKAEGITRIKCGKSWMIA